MALRMTKRSLVLLPPYRRILDKSDDTEMESAVRALFSDVLKTGDRIIIQVEEKWGDSTYFVDIQDRELRRFAGCTDATGKRAVYCGVMFLIYMYRKSLSVLTLHLHSR